MVLHLGHRRAARSRRSRPSAPPRPARVVVAPAAMVLLAPGSMSEGARAAHVRHRVDRGEAHMEALIWLATGTLSGWAAGKLMKGRDYGVSGNIILGMLGSVVGGWLFDALGFAGPPG